MKLNSEHIAILEHTSTSAPYFMYCGDSSEMQELVDGGLMRFAGKKSYVPDPYFTITDEGFEAVRLEALKNDS